MFQEMGLVPDQIFESFRERCETRLREMLATGEYLGWLASRKKEPEKVLAGGGVQLRHVLPHPAGDPQTGLTIADGRHAIIINVFTEPQWRRRGLATLLLKEIITRAGKERLDRLVLHASDEGRRSTAGSVSSRLTKCATRAGSRLKECGRASAKAKWGKQ